MQTQTLSVLFWLYRSKENKAGKCPIYLRVTLQKKKLNFSTGQFVEPEEWDRRKQRVKGKSDNAQLTNAILRKLESKLINLQRELLLKKGEIIFDDIRSGLSGSRQPSATLIASFQTHNDRILSLVGRGYAKATFEIYEITKREIQEFLRAKSKREDIPLQEIDIQFAQNLEVFYRLNKGNQTNTEGIYFKQEKA